MSRIVSALVALLLITASAGCSSSSPPSAHSDGGTDAARPDGGGTDALPPNDARPADGPGADGPGADGPGADGGGGWSAVVVDEQPNFKSRAAVALAADGTAHLAYNVATSADGWTVPSVWYAREQGGTFARQEVAPAGGVANEFPVIALDGQDRPHVFYNRNVAADDHVDLFVVRDQGAGFGAPVRLTSAAGVDEYGPSVARDGAGALHVVFQQRSGDPSAYVYSIGYLKIQSGTPSAVEVVASGTAMFSLSPDYDVTAADDGTAHVVYCKPGAATLNNVAYYRRRSAAGAWGPEQPVTPTDQDVWGPNAAVDSAGTVHLAYVVSPDWDTKTLTYQRLLAGSWTPAQTLTASTEDRAYYLGLAVGTGGRVHLAFSRFYATDGDILYFGGQDGAMGSEERVTTTASMDESYPAVAAAASGRVAVSFVENLSAAPNGRVYLATRQ
jgi:hypothetical protein